MTPIKQKERSPSTMLQRLDAEIRSCVRCADSLIQCDVNPPSRPEKVVPRPILSTPFSASIMLIGQAPSLTEYDSGLPFQGQAGNGIRSLFAACDVRLHEFDSVVYQTSAAKCFPGRKLNKKGRPEERQPDGTMLRMCSGFLRSQIEIVNPRVVVCLGVVAAKAIDRLRGNPGRKLGNVVGTVEKWGDRRIIFLAHTSPGSRFLNDEENKRLQAQGQRHLEHTVGLLRESGSLIRARPDRPTAGACADLD
jgi:uracil-DNA glycosylase family 4